MTAQERSVRPDRDWWYRHEERIREGRPVGLELFVRSLGPAVGTHRRQGELLERLQSLDRQGAVESVRVRVWGDAICRSACCSTHPDVGVVLDRAEQFLDWSEAASGVTVPFEYRRVASSVTDEQFEVLDLPTLSLAVWVDGTLDCVLPATVDGTALTVPSYLDWFERAHEQHEESLVTNA